MYGTRWLLNSLGAEVVHPGEVLWRVYMEPFGVSQNELARQLGLPPRCINEIVHGKRGITARTALLLARVYGGDGMDWLERQAMWDLDQARRALRQRKRPRRRNAPELARRSRAGREAARVASARAFQAETQAYLKANQIGAFKPGYGRAVPGEGDASPACQDLEDHEPADPSEDPRQFSP